MIAHLIILGVLSISVCEAGPLHRAVQQGNDVAVVQILDSAARPKVSFFSRIGLSGGSGNHENAKNAVHRIVNEKDKNGNTPLILAVAYGHLAIAEALIARGANLEEADLFRNTPLHRAVINNNIGMIEILLQGGANLDAQNLSHLSPMTLAIAQNKTETLCWMLGQSLDLSFRDPDQNTLLHLAAAHCQVETLLSILDKGLPLDTLNSLGRTPLMESIVGKKEENALLLSSLGAALTTRDIMGQTPGSLAKREGFQTFYRAVIGDLEGVFKSEGSAGISHGKHLLFLLDYDPRTDDPFWNRLEEKFLRLLSTRPSLEILTQVRKALKAGKFSVPEKQRDALNSLILEMGYRELNLLVAEAERAHSSVSENGQEGEIDSGLKRLKRAPIDTCPVCLESLATENGQAQNTGPADCACSAHLDCYRQTARAAFNNSGLETAFCVLGCGSRMTLAFLLRSGFTESEVKEFRNRQLKLGLTAVPGWKFCNTPECLNGKVLLASDSCLLDCCFCEKASCLRKDSDLSSKFHAKDCQANSQEHLNKLSLVAIQHLLEEGARAGGSFRPCYHCGLITEKNGGCNHMTCGNPACRRDWDWNLGEYRGHPSSGSGPMQFVPRVKAHT